ncbi:uncharacterized protein LOC120624419 isoform X2 [Pararge aegeria]|uniref:uncharacterized protein LOC120624419 isoform X2 n=1 Tax=Pararge aegeria TaxID=116150 RepID=UPI0019D238AF|nr:uncharacterized protein LOC120624419 isoform X2 [Pararge aegeria]
MGNSKSKKVQKEPDKFFERERWKEQKREEKKKKNVNLHKRSAVKDPPIPPSAMMAPPTLGTGPAHAPAHVRSYDDDALDRMRYQLANDSDAFLLNNILLSVQFFENYEREVHQIKNNPISERQHVMDEAMVHHHKHVFFADRIQECVQDHIIYQRRPDKSEPLIAPRLFIIYDNVEASEPGDTSDYCAVLDAPFYKLRIEDSKESGYVKLKKLEILESTLPKEVETKMIPPFDCDDSIYTDSEKESHASDDPPYSDREDVLQKDVSKKGNDDDCTKTEVASIIQCEENEVSFNLDNKENVIHDLKPRKSILKNTRRHSETQNKHQLDGTHKYLQTSHLSLDNITAEDTETSGYRSNASSRQTESSETESDYGYATITESTTPKKVELSLQTNYATTSGVLPDESWVTVNIRSVDWSDDDDDDVVSKETLNRDLYENHHYLSSIIFMNDFVDNFILHLGSGLGFSQDTVKNSLTQGASIYCNAIKNVTPFSYEVFPALIAAWPNSANQWIIRERKIIQNPRTNFSYQWPTRYMVSKAIGFGCLLVPIGFRPKRGINPDQKLQWKVMFPAAERYLESCLAHSHMRCYLFALTLQKTFMENETSKIGIDASHIKNHLFWQCEDNYARWPEDRLGESLRLFLRTFYIHFGKSRFPNYFIESCNEFKCIPKPLLLKLQRKLADILEAPVMHLLHAINKLKYAKKDFYPKFNCLRLYDILTCKNPLRILNPQLPVVVSNYNESSDSEDERLNNIWDKAKAHDKDYQWKKEKLKQLKERRANTANKKQKKSGKVEIEINKSIILPMKMEAERRRLVLEFFIPHFIAMARSSEKFDTLRQAVIYLEQAKRLCYLLREEPAGDGTANEYLDVIRDKLSDCQRKLVNQGGYKLPPRDKVNTERNGQAHFIRKHRPKCEHIINQDSDSITPFTFADIHMENNFIQDVKKYLDMNGTEESKL